MTETTLNAMDDIESLLDAKLDDLADMPEFKPFPAGAHKATIKWDYSELKEKKIIKLSAIYVEPVELNDTDAIPPKAGDKSTVTFFLRKKDGTVNEFGEGQWKLMLEGLSVSFPGTAKEIMDTSDGAEVLLITKIQQDKSDPKDIKNYTKFEKIAVL